MNHAYVPHRFTETETRCHCGARKSECPAWTIRPKRHITIAWEDRGDHAFMTITRRPR